MRGWGLCGPLHVVAAGWPWWATRCGFSEAIRRCVGIMAGRDAGDTWRVADWVLASILWFGMNLVEFVGYTTDLARITLFRLVMHYGHFAMSSPLSPLPYTLTPTCKPCLCRVSQTLARTRPCRTCSYSKFPIGKSRVLSVPLLVPKAKDSEDPDLEHGKAMDDVWACNLTTCTVSEWLRSWLPNSCFSEVT